MHSYFPQGNNWITVGQYDSKSKEITLRRDPVFPGGVTRIPGKGRPTYKIAAFFPTHEDLGPLRDLGLEWQAAFRVAVELVNTGPFKVAFSYVLVDGGEDPKSCRREAEVGYLSQTRILMNSCETFTIVWPWTLQCQSKRTI